MAKINYQQMSAELDAVLLKLQQSDLDVDEATKLYERGLELIDRLEAYLSEAENQVVELKARYDSKKSD